MSSISEYHTELDIIATDHAGCMDIHDLCEAAAKSISKAQSKQCIRFLSNFKAMEQHFDAGEISVIIEYLRGFGLTANVRQAVLFRDAPADNTDLETYATLCRSRGFNVRGFSDHDEAIAWLLQK